MLMVDGKEYYKVAEAAKLAGVNVRTLRRWIADGNLEHFLFPFRRTRTGPLYYRLEPPEETDVLWEGQAAYKILTGEEGAKNGERDEGCAEETGK